MTIQAVEPQPRQSQQPSPLQPQVRVMMTSRQTGKSQAIRMIRKLQPQASPRQTTEMFQVLLQQMHQPSPRLPAPVMSLRNLPT